MSLGKLILVGLPIGNLEDLSIRSRKQLENSQYLLAEDSRHIKKLFNLLDIKGPKRIETFHDHSQQKLDKIIKSLKEGKDITLVSEAGSPIISDPAYPLVRAAIQAGVTVTTCPGPSAVITALELCGLPPHPFHFHGFLPRETEKIRLFFEGTSRVYGTHLVFEAPGRVANSLKIIAETLPEAPVSILRELTKMFESTYYCQAKDLAELIPHIDFRGEFVIAYHVEKSQGEFISSKLHELAEKCLASNGHPKDLAKLLGEVLKRKTGDVYSDLVKNS